MPSPAMFHTPLDVEIYPEIQKEAGKILFYLSASNWNLVLARIRQKLYSLTNSATALNADDSVLPGFTGAFGLDLTELRFLEFCNLDLTRLPSLLIEMNQCFKFLPKRVQYLAAIGVRKCIWNWIDTHPAEFLDIHHNQRRIEGSPESFFNTLATLSDGTSRRRVLFWPTQMMLLALCPDLFVNVLVSVISVLANKPVSNNNESTTAISDYLRSLVAAIDFDIRDKLFSKLETRTSGSQGQILVPDNIYLDYSVPTDALTAILKLNPFASVPVLGMESDLKVGKTGIFAGKSAKREKIIKIQAIHDLAAENFDLVFGTLKVWAKSPALVVNENSILPLDELRSILDTIIRQTSNDDSYIRSKAGETLRAIFATDFVSIWDGSSSNWRFPSNRPTNLSMEVYWNVSSSVIQTIAILLLTIKVDRSNPENIALEHSPILKEILELLRDLLKVRTEFLTRCKEVCKIESFSEERLQATMYVEKALLVLLCSPSNEIVSTAISCIGYLVDEVEITTPESLLDSEEATGSLSISQNLHVYKELRTLVGGVGLIASSRAMQRRVRTVLLKMEKPSLGSLAAWEEVYLRWRTLFRPILQTSLAGGKVPGSVENGASSGSSSDRGERQNYTAFLCAMGGVCHAASLAITRHEAEIVDHTLSKIDLELQAVYTAAKKNVGEFLLDLQQLMVCENDVVREFVKNFLGSELHSGLFGTLFSSCQANVIKFLGPDEINNHERNLFFVESFISVLKLILERQYNENDQIEFHTMTGGVNFGSLIYSFVQYLNNVQHGSHMHSTFLSIRTKVCQLVEIVITKKDVVALRQEIEFKNSMLNFVLGWNAELHAALDDGRTDDSRRLADAQLKLTRDLDLASMRALVAILDGLPIQLTTETIASVSSALKPEGYDKLFVGHNEFKEHLFYRYLSFFLRVLDKCRTVEAIESNRLEANPGALAGEYNEQVLASKETLSYIYPLKDLIIRALSNLLQANIDIGLKYSLSMGYHEDSKTRASFMLVLANLLKLGGKEQFEGLGEEVEVMQTRYKRLVDMVVDHDDLNIALAMGGISDVDDVASILMSVFETKGDFSVLMVAAIEAEVERTDYAPNLFRQNSLATRLLTVFSKTYGREYLINAIKPVLDELLDIHKNMSFEIDPNKMLPGEEATVNRKNITTLVERLLDNLLGHPEKFPQELRVVCGKLAEIVGQRFPENKTTAVGAFMFLRFINPIIVAPWTLNVISPIQDRRLLRGLVLATKVIQNLANNVRFSQKEPFMADLNDLLEKNHGRVIKFLENVSVVDNSTIREVEKKMSSRRAENISECDLLRLHRVLEANLDKVEVALIGNNSNQALSQSEIAKRKSKYAQLAVLLTHIGPAPDQEKTIPSTAQKLSTSLHPDIATRVQSILGHEVALDTIRQRAFFYESGRSKQGNRVLYFIARRFKEQGTNLDIFLYFLLSVLSDFTDTKFELVVDLSQFSVENEWDISWIHSVTAAIPEAIRTNLVSVYFYRCNTGFYRYIKTISRSFDLNFNDKSVCFLFDCKQLSSFIAADEIDLPKSIIDSDKGIISKYEVSLISGLRDHSNVTLRLSADFIHLTHHKRQQVFGFDTLVTDVIEFADVKDISKSENLNEFVIKYVEKVGVTLLTSAARDIMASLKGLQASFNRRRGYLITDERTLRPDDVPGTLLNMALLNMGSHDPNLRLASYNLLDALSSSFDFQIQHQLLSTKGLCIPANDIQYVKLISKKLATAEKYLTLEFLIEFVIGFNKATVGQKIFCLEYLSPWLKNLVVFTNPTAAENEDKPKLDILKLKLKSLVKLLIEATVKEVELFHLIQTNLWTVIGNVDGILPIIMETFIQTSTDNGIASNHTQVLTNTLRSITTNNSEVVTSTIIGRLLELVGSATIQDLINTGTWTEVAVLIRYLLMLSFDDVIDIEKHLPDLFHIITLVAGYGQPLIRGSVHGITINLVHNVCTKLRSSSGKTSPVLSDMLAVLETLSDNKFKVKFGISNSGDDSEAWSTGKNDLSVSFANEASANEILEGVDPYDLKDITNELVKVVYAGCGDKDLASAWKDRWFQLIVTSTFNFSYVQSRTFITLGALSRESSSIDVLFSTVQSLMGYLPLNLTGLVVSITTCITDVIHGIPRNPETFTILKSLFWVALGLIQICDVHIFSAGAALLIEIIEILDKNKQFVEFGFTETLKESRRSVFLKLAMDLDDMTGIWFSSDFGFAFTATVLKGFKFEKTREQTVALLKLALDVSGRNPPEGVPVTGHDYVADHCVGFLIPLLPVTPTHELTSFGGEYVSYGGGLFETDEGNKFDAILERLTPLADENRSLLMLTIMVGILEISELEAEAIFIYGFFAEATLEAPHIIFKLYESLLPGMNEIVTGPNSPSLISAVHSIFQT
ncbi:hypothetical protein BDR26DRAFT_824234, partial [Obelidium mucronatum]